MMLQYGCQLPLTYLLHLLKENYVLSTVNADLTQFWLSKYLGCQHSYLAID